MTSKAKSHWENWTVVRLRKEARETYGIDTKGLRKKDLIHQMRLKAQEQK